MNKIQNTLLRILSNTFSNDILDSQIIMNEKDLEELYKEAKAHEVHLLIYPVVKKYYGKEYGDLLKNGKI